MRAELLAERADMSTDTLSGIEKGVVMLRKLASKVLICGLIWSVS